VDMFDYICISVAGLIAGVVVGAVGGLSLGWLLMLGYHKRGPSDPGDAPVYVAMGLTMLGACLGAIAGLAVGIIYAVPLARRKALDRSTQASH
jgi:ABC-type nitrate/sulfonate/bicarbonate transport system permease component